MRDKIIRIYWSKPLAVKEAIISPETDSIGLYYITRKIHGREESLYIGRAIGNNTIRNRLNSHINEWVNRYYGEKYVRVGKIVYPENTDEYIKQAEAVLIYEHRDVLADNTMNTKSYSYEHLYRIENEGDIFELNPLFRMHDHPDYK